jgi:hypothetical protein
MFDLETPWSNLIIFKILEKQFMLYNFKTSLTNSFGNPKTPQFSTIMQVRSLSSKLLKSWRHNSCRQCQPSSKTLKPNWPRTSITQITLWNYLLMQVRSLRSKCSKSWRHNSCESWEKYKSTKPNILQLQTNLIETSKLNLLMQVRSLWSKCSKSWRHNSCESWEK